MGDNRTSSGRFKKGVSGNPSGRPRSESTKLREQFAKKGEAVAKKVIELALDGDLEAARLIFARILPPLRAASEPVTLPDAKDKRPAEIAADVLRAAISGEMEPDTAARLIQAAGTASGIEEIEALRSRLAALESALSEPSE